MISINTVYSQDKLSTNSGHINILSTTPIKDIEVNNYKVTSSITPATGAIVFSVSMQSFEFLNTKMQQYYNSKKFLNIKRYPKGKFKGTITNISEIDFIKSGSYTAFVSGKLTIRGVSNNVSERIYFTIKNNTVTAKIEFDIILANYRLVFNKGKASKNIAKSVKVTGIFKYVQ